MRHHVIPYHEWKKRINPQATRNDREYNAPDNWVNLTTEQLAHVLGFLYEINVSEYDKIAQRMITGQIGKEEAKRLVTVYTNSIHKRGPHSAEWSRAQSEGQQGRVRGPYSVPTWNKGLKTGPLSESHKAKLKGRTPWNKGLTSHEQIAC